MINRREWTGRHNPVLKQINPESPLTVGNGELAYNTCRLYQGLLHL